MKKYLLFASLLISAAFSKTVAQTLLPTSNISAAGLADTFKGGYTFSYATAGTPWNGSLISYGGFPINNYDTQISSDYGPNGGNHISFRTRNGDISQWNNWNEIWHSGNLNNSSVDFNAYNLNLGGYITTLGGPNSENSFFSWGVGNGSWDSRPNDTYGKPFIIQHHTGLTFNAHSYYGGIRFYNQGYPNLFNSTLVMSIVNDKVGIGTTSPDSKLAVNGTIHSKEVKVDMIGWSDFVFKKEYTLPTLEEVENQIKEKGHLTNIPSEEEVLKNGINLGEMNAKLLQKIEEMTLYIIEQNKQIKELKNENENFRVVFDRLSKIEEKLK